MLEKEGNMRKIFKTLIACCLSALIICCFVVPCFADGANTDFQELFTRATTVDGAYAEAYADEISVIFDDNPSAFISALSNQPNEVINSVSEHLVYGHYFYDFEEFYECISHYETLDLNEQYVIQIITNKIQDLGMPSGNTSGPNTFEDTAKAFDQETIKQFIAKDKELGNTDEEFFKSIAAAYRADPTLFTETISALPQSDVEYLAKGIIYDNCVNGYEASVDLSMMSADTQAEIVGTILNNDGSATAFSDLFARSGQIEDAYVEFDDEIIADSDELDTEDQFNTDSSLTENDNRSDTSNSNVIESTAASTPVIGTMTYTSGALTVGTTETLRVVFTDNNYTSTRYYQVKVYEVINSTRYLKVNQRITIPSSTKTITAYFNMSFYDVGSFYTYVEVYSTSGTLLSSRTGTYPDNIYGYWKINVNLPTNRDYKGTLTLYSASGRALASGECIGKSSYRYNMYTTNVDTPTGTYTGYLDGPFDAGSYSIYNVINMTGVSGVIVFSGRSGIWIHGGRVEFLPQVILGIRFYPTYGCVRVSQDMQYTLQTKITSLTNSFHYNTGNITIS